MLTAKSSNPDKGEKYMEIFDLIMKRRSVRNFKKDDIPEHIIDKLMDAANNSPTGGNMQPYSIILVKDQERRKELARIVGNQPWVKNAPLSMIFCIDFHRFNRWTTMLETDFKGEDALSHFLIAFADCMCAAQSVVLLAQDHGLGSVYIGTILAHIDEAREYFQIPRFVLPIMVLSLGYPKSIPQDIPKLKKENIVHRERYYELSDEDVKKAFKDKYGELEENVEKYIQRAYVEVVEADKQELENRVEAIKKDIERLEIKNNAEFLFKLRYPADAMVKINRTILDSFENAGFGFFKKHD